MGDIADYYIDIENGACEECGEFCCICDDDEEKE